MSRIGSPIDAKNAQQSANADFHKTKLSELSQLEALTMLGGGKKNIAKQHEKGKLTARERIEKLIDKGTRFQEVGLFAAHGMYEEDGGAPTDLRRVCAQNASRGPGPVSKGSRNHTYVG